MAKSAINHQISIAFCMFTRLGYQSVDRTLDGDYRRLAAPESDGGLAMKKGADVLASEKSAVES